MVRLLRAVVLHELNVRANAREHPDPSGQDAHDDPDFNCLSDSGSVGGKNHSSRLALTPDLRGGDGQSARLSVCSAVS